MKKTFARSLALRGVLAASLAVSVAPLTHAQVAIAPTPSSSSTTLSSSAPITSTPITSTPIASTPIASSSNANAKPTKTFDHSMDAQLRRAVNADNDGSVRNMLVRGADPNLKDTDTWKSPLLAQAAFIGNLKMVRAFVEAGADLEATSSQGSTAMQYATTRGRNDIITYLRQQGANIERRSSAGTTPLIDAVAMGKLETVRALIAVGANVNARSTTNQTVLMYGAKNTATGNLEIVKMLVEAGADVSVQDDNGKRANNIAGDARLYDINSYLVGIYNRDLALFNVTGKAVGEKKAGTATSSTRLAGWQAIKDELAKGANPRYFSSSNNTSTLINLIAAFNDIILTLDDNDATMKTIIARSDLDTRTKAEGFTALHVAVDYNNAQMAKWLINAGANLNVLDNKDRTPLDMALTKKRQNLVLLLQNAGAKTSAQLKAPATATSSNATSSTQSAGSTAAKSKWTPERIASLSSAARDADEQLFGELNDLSLKKSTKGVLGPISSDSISWSRISDALDDGAPLLYRGVSGTTALMLVAENLPGAEDAENRDLIQNIIADADLDAQDDDGTTALHIAAKNGYLAMVNWLLKTGAAPNIADKAGKTPLDLALQTNNSVVAARLRDAFNSSSSATPKTTSSTRSVATPTPPKYQETKADKALYSKMLSIYFGKQFGRDINASDWEDVEKLLAEGATARFTGGDGDNSLIVLASDLPSVPDATAQKIIARADINAQNNKGQSALHIAAENNATKIVGWLVKAGANLNLLDKNNLTPMDIAVEKKNFAVIQLRDAGAKTAKQLDATSSTRLVATPTAPSSATPKITLSASATTTSATASETTRSLLQLLAGTTFNATAADTLLRQGADINSPDANGKTPLMIAGESGLPAAVKWLVSKKVNVNAADKNGMTALMYIASRADDKAANDVAGELIFADGLNFGLKNQAGKTALEIAQAKSNEKTAFSIDIASVL